MIRDQGVRLLLLLAMPVYLVLFFILVFDTYNYEADGKIHHIRNRGGTALFSQSPKAPFSSRHDKKIRSTVLIRKLAAYRGSLDPSDDDNQRESNIQHQHFDSMSDMDENNSKRKESYLISVESSSVSSEDSIVQTPVSVLPYQTGAITKKFIEKAEMIKDIAENKPEVKAVLLQKKLVEKTKKVEDTAKNKFKVKEVFIKKLIESATDSSTTSRKFVNQPKKADDDRDTNSRTDGDDFDKMNIIYPRKNLSRSENVASHATQLSEKIEAPLGHISTSEERDLDKHEYFLKENAASVNLSNRIEKTNQRHFSKTPKYLEYDIEYNDYSSETENTDKDFDYDWSFDRYGYKNYVRHYLFTDLFKPNYVLENPELCPNNTQTFVFISSRVDNSISRNAIRQTYLRKLAAHKNINYAFIVSKPERIKDLNALKLENEKNKDLIIAGCEESYFNLTLKSGHLLQWARDNCPTTTKVVKVDDDVYVNVPRFLDALSPQRKATIMGKVCSTCVPYTGAPYSVREALLYFSNIVTTRHIPLTQYPPFAMGPAYVITNDITGWLLEAAKLLPYFSYEDVFWTAMAVEVVNEESGITFELPGEQERAEQDIEEMETPKYKYLTMKDKKSPTVAISRIDIPQWRSDRKFSDSLKIALEKSQSSVIVHGIQWEKDMALVEALENSDAFE